MVISLRVNYIYMTKFQLLLKQHGISYYELSRIMGDIPKKHTMAWKRRVEGKQTISLAELEKIMDFFETRGVKKEVWYEMTRPDKVRAV